MEEPESKQTKTDKRKAILESTLQLISERGFHDTPMSLVAKESGVAAGTIYRYFDNKEALINELFIELKGALLQAAVVDIDEQDKPRKMLEKIWRNIFNYCIQNLEAMRFIEQFHNSPFQTPEIQTAVDKYYEPWIIQFETFVHKGIFRDIPFEMYTAFTYDLIIAFAKRHLNGTLIMDEQNMKLAFNASWDLITAEGNK
ncbi:MAG: TetR/AcrR family transcriptional regulator [Anaerolineaceae bacterium]|nr:TetR/AcrR family transcriptional regulator [Anaerolineaceae bacterium]